MGRVKDEREHLRESRLAEKSARGVAWSSFGDFTTQLVVLAVFIVLTNFVDPAGFGLFAMAGVILTLLEVVGCCGLNEALVQRENLEKQHLSSAFWISAALVSILTGGLLLLAYPVASLFSEPKLGVLLLVLAPRLLFLPTTLVQEALMARAFRFDDLARASLLGAVSGGVCAFVAALLGAGLWSLVIHELVRLFLRSLYIWIRGGLPVVAGVSWTHGRELLDYSRHVAGNQLANLFNFRLTYLIIGYFLGPADAGFFMLGNRIILALITVFGSVSRQVALPLFSRLQGRKSSFQEAFLRISGMLSLAGLPVFLGGLVAAPHFVPLLFGAEWRPAVAVVQLFMLIGISRLFNHLAGSCFSASGHPNWTLRISLWNGAANLLAVFVAVPFGLLAVVAATALRSFILLPLSWWLLKRLLRIELAGYLRWIAAPGAASAAMVGAGWLIHVFLAPALSDLAVLALQVGVCASFYSVFVLGIQPSLAGELKLFWQLLLGWQSSRP